MTFYQSSGKPIDLVFSDFVCVALFCFYIVRVVLRNISKPELHDFAIIAFALWLFFAMVSAGFMETTNYGVFLTFAKYAKVFIALIAGMGLARLYRIEDFWKLSVVATAVVTLLLLYSQIVITGSLHPRWGRTFLGFNVYGFPNSPASYYLILVMYMTTAWLIKRKYTYLVLSPIAAAFMILSLSRIALIVLSLFLVSFVTFEMNLRKTLKAVFVFGVVVVCMLFVMQYLDSLESAKDALVARYEKTFKGDDLTGGRADIALETLALVSRRPFAGYLFDSFDKYQRGHATPHNQYLEALFKTGILGFIVYFFVFLVFLKGVINKMKAYHHLQELKLVYIGFICVLFALSVGNLSQPNFTYSQTGNVVFLTLGYLAYARSGDESSSSVRSIR